MKAECQLFTIDLHWGPRETIPFQGVEDVALWAHKEIRRSNVTWHAANVRVYPDPYGPADPPLALFNLILDEPEPTVVLRQTLLPSMETGYSMEAYA